MSSRIDLRKESEQYFFQNLLERASSLVCLALINLIRQVLIDDGLQNGIPNMAY